MINENEQNQPSQKGHNHYKNLISQGEYKNQKADKYQSSNFTKAFLIQYIESQSDNDEDKQALKGIQQEAIYHPKRSRKSKILTQLAPLTQAKSTIVYHNLSNSSQYQSQKQSRINGVEDRDKEQENSHQILQLVQKDAVQFQDLVCEQKQQVQHLPLALNQKQFLLFDEDQSQNNTNKSSQSFIQLLPTNKKMLTEFYYSSSEKEKSTIKETGSSNKKHRKNHIIHKTMDFITTNNVQQMKKMLVQPLKKNTTLQLILNRNKDGFNVFWPQFYLQFQQQTIPLMVAKKVSSKPTATYIISTNPNNFQQNSQYYVGKIKSSLLGDINNLFGQGLNPTSAKQSNQVPRQLLATIVYSKLSASKSKPRQFQVFVKKPNYRYYLNFNKVVMYEEQVDLCELYKSAQCNEKIERYYNRKPVYDEQSQTFRLNFRGKVECSSIKNFILQKQNADGQEIMMFGKVNESKFNVEISAPLSPLVGFAVALTSFDSRLLLGD